MKTSMLWETPSTISQRDLKERRGQQGHKAMRVQSDLLAFRGREVQQDRRAQQESLTLAAVLIRLFVGMMPAVFGYVLQTLSLG
tara:strand:- start:129256 stop:129507 length:252 start_codon:yes stop_codon:yes gene_type:complete